MDDSQRCYHASCMRDLHVLLKTSVKRTEQKRDSNGITRFPDYVTRNRIECRSDCGILFCFGYT